MSTRQKVSCIFTGLIAMLKVVCLSILLNTFSTSAYARFGTPDPCGENNGVQIDGFISGTEEVTLRWKGKNEIYRYEFLDKKGRWDIEMKVLFGPYDGWRIKLTRDIRLVGHWTITLTSPYTDYPRDGFTHYIGHVMVYIKNHDEDIHSDRDMIGFYMVVE